MTWESGGRSAQDLERNGWRGRTGSTILGYFLDSHRNKAGTPMVGKCGWGERWEVREVDLGRRRSLSRSGRANRARVSRREWLVLPD